jgi:hypothetical protein
MAESEQPHSRIIYPRLPEALTAEDLQRWFTLTSEERQWAATVARWGTSMVSLLTHLKVFQHIGRFLPPDDLPATAIAHAAVGVDHAGQGRAVGERGAAFESPRVA